jgi:hypothetical protein
MAHWQYHFRDGFLHHRQILLFAFGVKICDAIKHYIDGLFFFSLCMLLSVLLLRRGLWRDTGRGAGRMPPIRMLGADGELENLPLTANSKPRMKPNVRQ